MNSDKESTPTFGDATRVFRGAGVPSRAMLPIAPPDGEIDPRWRVDRKSLGKVPGRYNARTGTWRGLSGDYVQEGVGPDEQLEFAPWPTGNVGLLGRAFPAVDSDAGSEAGRRLVERAIVETFGTGTYAERLRGGGPRRLYAFRAMASGDKDRAIINRAIKFCLPGEPEHVRHGVDILGTGKQFLIAGTHPSGEPYGWQPAASLTDSAVVRRLARIEEADAARFVAVLEAAVEAAGGTIVSTGSGSGGGSGELRDFADADPAMPPTAILAGLRRVPNTEANFPGRDDLVRAVSALRAALGREADAFEANVRDWACEDPIWCDDSYFDRIWQSLDRGVRVGRDALDHLFRQYGVGVGARFVFPDDAEAVMASLREHIAENRDERATVLADVARRYVFGEANIRTDDSTARVRSRDNVMVEWDALKWWRGRTDDHDAPALLDEIQKHDRWGRSEDGMWAFIRDLKAAHPDVFYSGETLHPNHDRGEMAEERDESDRVTYRLNIRELSRVQRLARQPTKSAERDEADVRFLLEFMHRVFGRHVGYELDTLSFMAQTGRRPGHLLLIVGDQGTGKSAYTKMLTVMFDGSGIAAAGGIDGNKLVNDSAVRFAFANAEGRRILEIKELPERSRTASQAGVTSILKQLVDPSSTGDFVQIEQKGKDPKSILNLARVVITTNYSDALHIEAQDRRIFFVRCGITSENKPAEDYYDELWAIINSAERLAAFWRYLRRRDISRYRVEAHPPVSMEKQEAQIAGMSSPWERLAEVALVGLQYAGRDMFDLAEVAGMMAALAENEYRNSNHAVDDRQEFDFGNPGRAKAALSRIARVAVKLDRELKVGRDRLPTIYVMKTAAGVLADLETAKPAEIRTIMERDRDIHPMRQDHPVSLYSGPLRVERKARRA